MAREATGLAGTSERARQHERERAGRQMPPEDLGLAPAGCGEANVRAAGVLTAEGPVRLPVADQPDRSALDGHEAPG